MSTPADQPRPLPSRFLLDDVLVDVDGGRVVVDGEERRLAPRVMTLLCALARAAGETVRREDLVDEIWPRGHVNEEALSRAVAELRAALGDQARQPTYLETIPKRGYRLLVSPAPVTNAVARRRWWLQAALVALLALVAIALWLPPAPPVAGPLALDVDPLAIARRQTADPGMEIQHALSDDGRWLAFVSRTADGVAVHVRAIDQADSLHVLTAPGGLFSPAFHPSGTRLAAVRDPLGHCEVVELSLAGGAPTVLAPCIDPGESGILDWSPDGEWLAYVAPETDDGSAAIWRVRVRDGTRERLTAPGGGYAFDTRPRFSPDGTRLSFTRGTRAVREVWLLDLAPGETGPRAISVDQQFTIGHDWLPDGRTLLLDSDRSGFRALWTLTLDGAWTLVGGRDAQNPTVAATGVFAFETAQYEANLWPLDIENGRLGAEPVIASTRYDSTPAWSPDGEELAFSSNRSGAGAIWIATAGGMRARRVYQPEEGRALGPSWRPDGKALYATEYGAGSQRLVEIALDRRSVRELATRGERPYGPVPSPDGRWLYYVASEPGGALRLWRMAPDGGSTAAPWSGRPINRALVDADGRVWFSEHGRSGLWRAPADRPEAAEPILPDLSPRAWDDWTVHDGWVYYPSTTGLRRRHPERNIEEQLAAVNPTALGPTVAVHPGGQRLLLARTDRAEADVFVVPPRR